MESNNNHIHKYTHTVVPATCQECGYTLHRCECGAEHKDNFTPKGDHSFEQIDFKAPTCTEEGTKTFKCSVCGITKTEKVAALGHKYGSSRVKTEPTCTTVGENISVCTVCGITKTEKIPPLGHSFGEWNTNIYPTCIEEGSDVRICGRCGHREERVVKAKGHKLTNPKKSKTEKGMVEYFCQNCGQTVVLPSAATKTKSFFARIKKKFLAIAIVISLIIAAFIAVLCLNDPVEYAIGKQFLKAGNYTQAYYCFRNCRAYKDTYDIFKRFEIEYENETRTSYSDGEVDGVKRYERKFDDMGNEIYFALYNSPYEDPEYVINREYNEFGDETLYIKKNSKGKTLEKTESKYDGEGRLLRCVDYNEDGEQIIREENVYNDQGDIITSVTYDKIGSLTDKVINKYDDRGNLIYKIDYSSEYDVSEDDYVPEHEYEYEYDSRDNLIIQTCYDGNKDITEIIEYEYDKDGNQISKIILDPDGNETDRFKYEYDKNGNNIKTVNIDLGGNETLGSEFEYDRKGNQRSAIHYYENGNVRTEYKYFADGRISSRIEYYENGEIISKATYNKYGHLTKSVTYYENGEIAYKSTYNKNGDELSRVQYDENGEVIDRYEYKYDRYGNMTRSLWGDKPGLTDLFSDEEQKYIEEVFKYDRYGNQTYYSRRMNDEIYTYPKKYKYDFFGIPTKITVYRQEGKDGERIKSSEATYSDPVIIYNGSEI